MRLVHIYVKIPWYANNKFQKAKIRWKKIKHETAVERNIENMSSPEY
jgi:hypothetical protein